MAIAFSGTLQGQGTVALNGAPLVPTDVDIFVVQVGPQVDATGIDGHRFFKRLGYLQFLNNSFHAFSSSQPAEAVSEPLWFNCESQDAEVHTVLNSQATEFIFWISPGSQVQVQVSF